MNYIYNRKIQLFTGVLIFYGLQNLWIIDSYLDLYHSLIFII